MTFLSWTWSSHTSQNKKSSSYRQKEIGTKEEENLMDVEENLYKQIVS